MDFSFNHSFLLCLAIPEPKGDRGVGFLSRHGKRRLANSLDGGRDCKGRQVRQRELPETAAAWTAS